MGRDTYRFRSLDQQREERDRMNPVWRGVGCITIVVFAIAGYLFAQWFLRANAVSNWVYLPAQAFNPDFPTWLNFIEPYTRNGALIKFIVTLLFVVISFGVVNFFYSIGFPFRPRVVDAPPPDKRLAKRQKRAERRATKNRKRYRY